MASQGGRDSMEAYLERHGVNTVLRSLVAQLCIARPERPVQFMVQYLQRNHLHTEQSGSELENDEADLLFDDEDDQFDTISSIDIPQVARHRRGAVSAESGDDSNAVDSSEIEMHQKDPEQLEALEKSLCNHIMFAHLEKFERQIVFNAMSAAAFPAGDVLIQQGDQGDNFYVLEEGVCEIFKREGAGEEKLVMTVQPGGSFGELALIYGTARAATVKAKTDCKAYVIDRKTYRALLMGATMKKRQMYEEFLEKVPFLASLTKYERLIVADALEPETFSDGEVIVRQGDIGMVFYIIVEGIVRVTKNKDDEPVDAAEDVGKLEPGQYFGEIALLTNRPRAANVIANGEVKVAKLDRDRFTRVMGPCEDILRRNMESYGLFAEQ